MVEDDLLLDFDRDPDGRVITWSQGDRRINGCQTNERFDAHRVMGHAGDRRSR
jgi:hypothetical protein